MADDQTEQDRAAQLRERQSAAIPTRATLLYKSTLHGIQSEIPTIGGRVRVHNVAVLGMNLSMIVAGVWLLWAATGEWYVLGGISLTIGALGVMHQIWKRACSIAEWIDNRGGI